VRHGYDGTAVEFQDLLVLGADYVFKFDTTTWGWVHMVIGVVVFAAGIGLLAGATWARVVAVVLPS